MTIARETRPLRGLLLGATALGCVALGCGASSATGDSAGPRSPGGSGSGSGGTSAGAPGPGGVFDAGVSDAPPLVLPPETELESSFELPIATGRFVWSANPTSGRVALIDGATLEVRTAQAGNGPTFLAAVPSPGEDAVIVLNVLSDDATVLRARGTALTTQTIKGLAHGGNAWAASADARWAVAWTDARQIAHPAKTQSFQDLTVIDLKATDVSKAATILAVGYRPAAIAFSSDGARAFAVTQDGVSVIELGGAGGPRVSKNVIVTDDPTADADTRDVSITPNGRLALLRQEGRSALVVVDLTSGLRTALELGAPITDVDLTADGSRAVAVLRDTAEVVILPLGDGTPTIEQVTRVQIPGEIIGSVSLTANGTVAVLYSNATAAQRLTVLTLPVGGEPAYHVVKLHAPVLSAFPAPDGQHAVVFHRADDPPSKPAVPVDGGAPIDAGAPPAPMPAPAFSLVPLDGTRPARIQDSDTPPRAVAFAPSSARALITVRDDAKAIFGVFIGTFPTLEVTRYPLASPPIAAGVVAAAQRGFVAQKHPEGRITFISLDQGDARTLTGFELGARVVDWSQP